MDKKIIVAMAVVLALVIAFIVNYLKKSQYNKILNAIKQQNYKEFEEIVNSKLSSFLYSSLYLDSLRLESAYLRSNKKEINELLDRMLKQKLSEKQKDQILSKAFNYYLSAKDKDNCFKYLNLMENCKNQRMIRECKRVYDVYMDSGFKYLDELLDETEMLDECNRGVNEYLISLMYQNKGDKEMASKYLQLSQKHLNEFDEKRGKN